MVSAVYGHPGALARQMWCVGQRLIVAGMSIRSLTTHGCWAIVLVSGRSVLMVNLPDP